VSDECTLYKVKALIVDLNDPYLESDHEKTEYRNESMNDDEKKEKTPPSLALCVELVGSRFLRRMVRLLVATAIRESIADKHSYKQKSVINNEEIMNTNNDIDLCMANQGNFDRDYDVLLNICMDGKRSEAASAAPGVGLALCGVGYNINELNKKKHNIGGTSKDINVGNKKIKLDNSVKKNIQKRKLFKVDLSWIEGFERQLVCCNPELLLCTQRCFKFRCHHSDENKNHVNNNSDSDNHNYSNNVNNDNKSTYNNDNTDNSDNNNCNNSNNSNSNYHDNDRKNNHNDIIDDEDQEKGFDDSHSNEIGICKNHKNNHVDNDDNDKDNCDSNSHDNYDANDSNNQYDDRNGNKKVQCNSKKLINQDNSPSNERMDGLEMNNDDDGHIKKDGHISIELDQFAGTYLHSMPEFFI
jgi:hypothetical protein